MVVLGLDPGITNVGIGVVHHHSNTTTLLHAEVIQTSHQDPAPARLHHIYTTLSGVITTHKPEALAVEDQFFYKQNELAYKIGWAMGVVMLCAKQHDLEVYGYAPSKVKSTLVGTGRADKDQIAFMVQAILKLKTTPKPSHLADALAIAITHAFMGQRTTGTRY